MVGRRVGVSVTCAVVGVTVHSVYGAVTHVVPGLKHPGKLTQFLEDPSRLPLMSMYASPWFNKPCSA